MNAEKLAGSISDHIISPLASLAKVALRSRKASALPAHPAGRPLIIMGNGPSLRSFLDEGETLREGFDLMSVNFAARTDEYFAIRPDLYILADPHFFRGVKSDPNVGTLWDNLRRTDWPMTLWLPLQHRREAQPLAASLPKCVETKWFNLTPLEGKGTIVRKLIHHGWGMPRPRNVLIPAIMTALRQGYRDIFLVGADHTWSKSLWVDDENRVISVQPHFYKDNEKERQRVASEYAGYHLHDILNSLTVAFRSYFAIRDYADSIGARIVNATPGSFIDAFPRCGYAQMKTLSTM